MTYKEASGFQGSLARVTSRDSAYGVSVSSEGRVELLDEHTLQVVGQPKLNGIPLGDAVPHTYLIEHIVEIVPLV